MPKLIKDVMLLILKEVIEHKKNRNAISCGYNSTILDLWERIQANSIYLRCMKEHFIIKASSDKLYNSRMNVVYECIGIYAATWLILLIGPLLASSRSSIRYNDSHKQLIGNLYKDPSSYYSWFFMISAITTFIYIILQLRYKRITEINIFENEWIFTLTNRFGLKFIKKQYLRTEIKPELNETKYNEILGLTFYLNRDIYKIGNFRFNNFSRLSVKEKKLIELTFNGSV